jgi:putative DNA primase/helicase
MDFEALNRIVLGRVHDLLAKIMPGGKLIGKEYTCGSVRGGPGSSCKVNTDTGKWADFATGQAGSDLISLWAEINGKTQGEAYKEMALAVGFSAPEKKTPLKVVPKSSDIVAPPASHTTPPMVHHIHGKPSMFWAYPDQYGKPIFYIARYDFHNAKGEHEKSFSPWSWSESKKMFIQKGWPEPRPLYGLDELRNKPDLPVMITEGELSCESARELVQNYYVVVTWPNGSKAWSKADWSPLKGKDILIWPDADETGRKAGAGIGEMLSAQAKSVKIIDVSDITKEGWDAADALKESWDWDTLKVWAKPRVKAILPQSAKAAEPQPNVEQNKAMVSSLYALYEQYGFALTKNGVPHANAANILKMLRREPTLKDLVWFDEFYMQFRTRGDTEDRQWTEVDELNLLVHCQDELGIHRLGLESVRQAVRIHAMKNKRNEPKDWMNSLVWDGRPRLKQFFTEYFDVAVGHLDPDEKYNEAEYFERLGVNWILSMVARIFAPGCKMDQMVILEGNQGILKSSVLGVIGGKWYTEMTENLTSKDFYMALQGKLIVEISELSAFSKHDFELIKKVISCQTDRYRPPYGRVSEDFPRRCVFVGTTNEDDYLNDPTGSRRFWPVRVERVHMEKLQADRDQIFAEAVSAFKQQMKWWLMPEEVTKAQQALRRSSDVWEDRIEQFVTGKETVTVFDVATDPKCLGMDIARVTKREEMRIAKCLKALGWEKGGQTRLMGPKRVVSWVRQIKTTPKV